MAIAGHELHDHHHHHELDDHHEATQAPLGRRLGAEFIGTLLFVAIGTGAATVLALGPVRGLGGLTEILQGAPGQDKVFGALLGVTFADVLAVALAFAFGLAALVYAFGGVSGAHFNPAVTFALAVARRFKWKEVPLYWMVQILGAISGAFVVAGIYAEDGAALGGTPIRFGATVISSELSDRLMLGLPWSAILAEAFIAFILMTAIMAVAVDHRAPKGWSGLVIGLALAAGILVTADATGGSANFARSLGPFVASLPYDVGNIPWSDLWVYAIGPLIGATAAALVYESVTGLESAAPAPEPGAATHDEDLPDHMGTGVLSGGGVAGGTGPGSSVPPGLAPTGNDPLTPPPGPNI